jgi:hypothetical protein
MKNIIYAIICLCMPAFAYHATIEKNNLNITKEVNQRFKSELAKKGLTSEVDLGEELMLNYEETNNAVLLRKYYNKASDRIFSIAVNKNGDVVDIDKIELLEKEKIFEKYGIFSKDLRILLDKFPDDSIINVAMWIKENKVSVPELNQKFSGGDDQARAKWDADMKSYQSVFHNKIKDFLSQMANKLALSAQKQNKIFNSKSLYPSDIVPVIKGKLTVAQIKELKHDPDIAAIDVIGGEVREEKDLAGAAYVMNVDFLNYYNNDGRSVKSAVLESGYPNFTTQLGLDSVIFRVPQNLLPAGQQNDQHVAYMISSIRNRRTTPANGRGFAYACNLYAANYAMPYTGGGVINWQGLTDSAEAAISWATGNNVKVISWSWHLAGSGNYKGLTLDEQHNGDQSYLDRVTDYVSTHYPYPIFCQAAGNIDDGDNTEFVNHKGYNPIVVGQDLQTSQMCPGSVWRNPNSGQELPHITAGVDYTMSMFENPDGTPVVTPNGGTSVAAALIAGFCTDLVSGASGLSSWPEAIRAIAMASGDNVVGNKWYGDRYIEQKDGCGRANGIDAYYMAANEFYGGSSTAGNMGWYANTYYYGGTVKKDTIRVNVTSTAVFDVVLSWSARVSGTNYSTETLSDLDITVYKNDGTFIQGSYSGVNPVEVLNMENISTGTYYIIVNPYSINVDTYYAVAWSNR